MVDPILFIIAFTPIILHKYLMAHPLVTNVYVLLSLISHPHSSIPCFYTFYAPFVTCPWRLYPDLCVHRHDMNLWDLWRFIVAIPQIMPLHDVLTSNVI